jgi:hypothetical protein
MGVAAVGVAALSSLSPPALCGDPLPAEETMKFLPMIDADERLLDVPTGGEHSRLPRASFPRAACQQVHA